MSVRFQFANGGPTLVDMLKILRTEGILDGDIEPLGDAGESARLGNLELLREAALAEVGFGLFLAWFHEHKFGKRFPDEGSYHLVGIDGDTTLFLCHRRRTLAMDVFLNQLCVSPEAIVPATIGTGGGACDRCPLRYALKYNYSALYHDETPSSSDPDCLLSGSHGNCGECKQAVAVWVKQQIQSDVGASILLGGDGCLLRASPRLYEFLLRPGDPSTEPLLNSFLVIELGLRHHFFAGMSGAEFREPFMSGEIDGLLFDQEGERVMCFETTRSYEIQSEHLRKAMPTAAAIRSRIGSNTAFAYVTLSSDDNVRGGERGNLALVDLLAGQMPFHIVGIPPALEVLKKSGRSLDRRAFRQLFDHYLDRLDQVVPRAHS